MRYALTAESDGFTVKDLLKILKDADPDALIIIGSDDNHCEDHLYQVNTGKHLVGFFTEPAEE